MYLLTKFLNFNVTLFNTLVKSILLLSFSEHFEHLHVLPNSCELFSSAHITRSHVCMNSTLIVVGVDGVQASDAPPIQTDQSLIVWLP